MSKKYSLSQSTNKFVTGVSASAFLLSGALNSGSVEAWNLSDLFSSAWWAGVWESILSWFSSTNTQELVKENVVTKAGYNNKIITGAQNGENIINLKYEEKKGIEIQVDKKSKEHTENLEKNINNERKNGIIGNKVDDNDKINDEKDNDVKENEGEDISEDIKEINIKEEIKENEKKEEDIIKIKNNNENQEKEERLKGEERVRCSKLAKKIFTSNKSEAEKNKDSVAANFSVFVSKTGYFQCEQELKIDTHLAKVLIALSSEKKAEEKIINGGTACYICIGYAGDCERVPYSWGGSINFFEKNGCYICIYSKEEGKLPYGVLDGGDSVFLYLRKGTTSEDICEFFNFFDKNRRLKYENNRFIVETLVGSEDKKENKKDTKIDNKVLPKQVIGANNKKHEIKNEENSINIDIINTDNKQNDNIEEKKNYEHKTMGNLLAKKDKMPQNSQEEEVPPKSKEDCEKLLKEKESELGMAKSNLECVKKYEEDIDRFSSFSLYKEAKDGAGRKAVASLMLGMCLKEFEKQKAYVIDNCNGFLKGFLKEYGDESEEDVNRYIKKLREGTFSEIAEDEDVGFKRYLEYTELYCHVENFWACTFLYIYSECDSAESIEKKLEEELKTLRKDIKDLEKIISDFDEENSGNNKINENSQILNDD